MSNIFSLFINILVFIFHDTERHFSEWEPDSIPKWCAFQDAK